MSEMHLEPKATFLPQAPLIHRVFDAIKALIRPRPAQDGEATPELSLQDWGENDQALLKAWQSAPLSAPENNDSPIGNIFM